MFLDVGNSVCYRLRGEIVIQPMSMLSIVFDPFALSKSFANKNSSLKVNMKCDGVGDVGFRSEQIDIQILRVRESLNGFLPFIRRLSNFGSFWKLLGCVL